MTIVNKIRNIYRNNCTNCIFYEKKIRDIAKEFAKKLNSNKINTIILFGSVARGEDSEDSDIDILIVSDYWEEIDSEITDLIGKIMYGEDELISAHVMNTDRFENTQHYSFLSNVLKDSVILV